MKMRCFCIVDALPGNPYRRKIPFHGSNIPQVAMGLIRVKPMEFAQRIPALMDRTIRPQFSNSVQWLDNYGHGVVHCDMQRDFAERKGSIPIPGVTVRVNFPSFPMLYSHSSHPQGFRWEVIIMLGFCAKKESTVFSISITVCTRGKKTSQNLIVKSTSLLLIWSITPQRL